MERAKETESKLSRCVKEVELKLENSMLRAEVERLRAVEKVRDEERDHTRKWVDDWKEGFRAEKRSMEERIARLEAETASKATAASTGGLMDSSGPQSVVAGPATTAVCMSAPSTPFTSASVSTTTASSSGTSTSITSSPATGTAVTDSTSVISSVGSAEMIVKPFETQCQLLAAQVQAATLPPLILIVKAKVKVWNSNDLRRGLDWLSGLKRPNYAS